MSYTVSPQPETATLPELQARLESLQARAASLEEIEGTARRAEIEAAREAYHRAKQRLNDAHNRGGKLAYDLRVVRNSIAATQRRIERLATN